MGELRIVAISERQGLRVELPLTIAVGAFHRSSPLVPARRAALSISVSSTVSATVGVPELPRHRGLGPDGGADIPHIEGCLRRRVTQGFSQQVIPGHQHDEWGRPPLWS